MKVLIGYDGSIHAETAIEDLERAGLPADTDARVLAVVEQPFDAAMDDATDEVCARIQRSFRYWSLQSEVATGGHPGQTILDRAREWPADLVVLGTHGRSALRRLVLGSVSSTVARDAPCSVRVARPREARREGPVRLLIGFDGSPQSKNAVNEVGHRTWPAGTEVRLVTVTEPVVPSRADEIAGVAPNVRQVDIEQRDSLHDLANESRKSLVDAGLSAASVILEGDPRETLLREARTWHPDSIILGARGLGLLQRFLLGSVSTAVLTHAPCTVEVVRRH